MHRALGILATIVALGCHASAEVGSQIDAGEVLDADTDVDADADSPHDSGADADPETDARVDAGDGIVLLSGDPSLRHEVAPNSSAVFAYDLPVSGAYDFRFFGTDGTTLPHGLVLTYSFTTEFAQTTWMRCGANPAISTCRFSLLPKGRIYFRVESVDAAPEAFTLAPIHTLGVGAATDPVSISATPRASAIDGWSANAYEFTTDAAGSYRVDFGTSDERFVVQVLIGGEWTGPYFTPSGPSILNNLEPNTRYVVGMNGASRQDVIFDIAIAKGLSDGSFGAPVQVGPEGVVTGRLDAQGIGFYAFDAPSEGIYRFEMTSGMDGDATLAIDFARADTYIANGRCWTWTGHTCTLEGLVSGRNVLSVSNLGVVDHEFTLTITAEP